MKKTLKSNEGITLIALVITIIVLLILAGVAISMLVGDNGVLKKAVEAKESTERESLKEEIKLEIIAAQMESKNANSNLTKEQLEGILKKYGTPTYDEEENLDGLTPNKGDKIPLSEIYDGEVAPDVITWTFNKKDLTVASSDGTRLNIGDYVNYDAGTTGEKVISESNNGNGYGTQTFDFKTGLKWRVLGADENGQLLLVSEDIIEPSSGGYWDKGRNHFMLDYQQGYQYGINELKKICEVYGEGTYATGARSIKVEDINNITGYNPEHTGVNVNKDGASGGEVYGKDNIYQYGNEVTYMYESDSLTNYLWYKNGIEQPGNYEDSFTYLDGDTWKTLSLSNNSIKLKSDSYQYYPCSLNTTPGTTATTGLDSEKAPYKMLFENPTSFGTTGTSGFHYWLDSRCVYTDDYVDFCLREVSNGKVGYHYLYSSNGDGSDCMNGVRPVVSLSLTSGIELTKESTKRDGCDQYNISK